MSFAVSCGGPRAAKSIRGAKTTAVAAAKAGKLLTKGSTSSKSVTTLAKSADDALRAVKAGKGSTEDITKMLRQVDELDLEIRMAKAGKSRHSAKQSKQLRSLADRVAVTRRTLRRAQELSGIMPDGAVRVRQFFDLSKGIPTKALTSIPTIGGRVFDGQKGAQCWFTPSTVHGPKVLQRILTGRPEYRGVMEVTVMKARLSNPGGLKWFYSRVQKVVKLKDNGDVIDVSEGWRSVEYGEMEPVLLALWNEAGAHIPKAAATFVNLVGHSARASMRGAEFASGVAQVANAGQEVMILFTRTDDGAGNELLGATFGIYSENDSEAYSGTSD